MKRIIKNVLLGIGALFMMVVLLALIFVCLFSIASAFARAFDKDRNLIKATINEDMDKVVTLIEKGADVNFIDACDGTALTEASESGNSEIVKCLVENGANLDFQAFSGQTGLDFAEKNEHI